MFQCRPRSQSVEDEIEPPYFLVKNVTLVGSFFVTNGSMVVDTTATQLPSLVVGDLVQFLSQAGIFYEVMAITATTITLTTPYSGVTANTGAFKEVPAPVTFAFIYSTSPLDTGGFPTTVPPVPPGPGARKVELTYLDSTGAGPFTITTSIPNPIGLAPGSLDIAVIESLVITSTGSFKNSVGQITLAEVASTITELGPPTNPTSEDFKRLIDKAQMLITRHLVYLPPSYFALAQQGASRPQLKGDFFVTTGQKHVPTTADQTAVLAPGHIIQFASQLTTNVPLGTVDVFYTIEAVGPKSLTLTQPYTGIDENFTGNGNVNSNAGTMGNLGVEVQRKATGAMLIDPSPAAPPTNDELKVLLGQFVQPATVGPPPDMLSLPAPTVLSSLFTQTLQLALAGVPIKPEPIAFI